MRELTNDSIKMRFKLEYDKILASQKWRNFLRRVDTDQPDGESYGGTQGVRGMTEKRGNNIRTTVTAETFTLRNRDWESGVVIPRKNWNYNKTAETYFQVDQLARLAAVHPGDLSETLINAGATTTIADGVYFFSASHPIYGGTDSNLLTASDVTALNVGTTTAPTSSEWADALIGVAVNMLLKKDAAGNLINLGIRDFTVLAPKGLYPSLLKALSQQLIASGESSPLKGISEFSFTPVLLPNSTETTVFLMMANGQSSMVYQVLEDPTNSVEVFGPESEYYRLNDEIFVKASGCYNVGFDRWQGAVHCTLS